MLKKLTPIGNSYGVIIDRAILQLLQIDPDSTQLDLTLENGKLVLVPVQGPPRAPKQKKAPKK